MSAFSEGDEVKALALEERIARLEKIALKLCEETIDTEYSWQKWADPFKEFIKETESPCPESVRASNDIEKASRNLPW